MSRNSRTAQVFNLDSAARRTFPAFVLDIFCLKICLRIQDHWPTSQSKYLNTERLARTIAIIINMKTRVLILWYLDPPGSCLFAAPLSLESKVAALHMCLLNGALKETSIFT